MNIFKKLFQPQRKAAPPKIATRLFPSWVEETARWLLTNHQSFIDEGFNLNPIIFAAIMYKARAASSVPLIAYTGTRQQPTIEALVMNAVRTKGPAERQRCT